MAGTRISQLAGKVDYIKVAEIKRNQDNPRGEVSLDETFTRLMDSIAKVGLLVPLVVRQLPSPEGSIRYELVDGERRFLACKKLVEPNVPAHVLPPETDITSIRRLMFHLHMTREQWTPLAQCKALSEEHAELEIGLKFDEKEAWALKLKKETGMSLATARDRVHVLSWHRDLKERYYGYSERWPKRDVYSYILALEVSIIEPSRICFKEVFNGKVSVDDGANKVRAALYAKVEQGLETNVIRSRDQIRQVNPLFSDRILQDNYEEALSIFRDLIEDPRSQFDDVRAEMEARFASIVTESALKPQRLLSGIRKWESTLRSYEKKFVEEATDTEAEAVRLCAELSKGLRGLCNAADELAEKLV